MNEEKKKRILGCVYGRRAYTQSQSLIALCGEPHGRGVQSLSCVWVEVEVLVRRKTKRSFDYYLTVGEK